MANPKTKPELLEAMANGYAKLKELIVKMSQEKAEQPFKFTFDPKKCGVRWKYDRCLRDLLMHIYEYQVLMRIFVQNIRVGQQKDYLPDEFRKNYHEMDKMIVEKYQGTKGYFKCTYTTDMSAYFVSVTSSPYGQAVKLLNMHQKA